MKKILIILASVTFAFQMQSQTTEKKSSPDYYTIYLSNGNTIDENDIDYNENVVTIEERGISGIYKFKFKYGLIIPTGTSEGDFFNLVTTGKKIRGCSHYDSGKPYLHFCFLSLPWQESNMVKITDVILGNYLELPFTLHPSVYAGPIDSPLAQPIVSRSGDNNTTKSIEPYSGWFPKNNATIQTSAHGSWGKWYDESDNWITTEMVNLFVTPMKYDYEHKRLRIYSEMEVRVEFKKPIDKSSVNDLDSNDNAANISYYDMLGREAKKTAKGCMYIRVITTVSGKRLIDKVIY